MALVKYEETEDGFRWGALELNRIGAYPPTGGVQVEIRTPKVAVQIYVTETGRVIIGQDWATYQEAVEPADLVIRFGHRLPPPR